MLTVLCILFGAAEPSVAQDGRILELVRKVESTSGPGREKAIREVLSNYKDYCAVVLQTNSPINQATARVIDNQRLAMVRDTWAAMARNGSGARTVIPVGSAANPQGPNYVLGKSDVDMIPYGFNSAVAADRFNETFTRNFGIAPASLQVNVLSPTNIKDWQARVGAVADFEKYNTIGGNIAVQQIMYDGNGPVWTYAPDSGDMQVKTAREWMGGNRPILKLEHAAGFYSDNSRFRAEYSADTGLSVRELAFKQGKYDERNGMAYLASRGLISIDQERLIAEARRNLEPEDARLFEAARLARQNDVDGAVRLALSLPEDTPVSDADVRKYLDKMEALNQRVGREVIENHARLALQPQSPSWMREELAGILANLPESQVESVVRSVAATPGNERVVQTISRARVASRDLRDAGNHSRFESDFVASAESGPAAFTQAQDTRDKLNQESGDSGASLLGSRIPVIRNILAIYEAYQDEDGGGRGLAAAGGQLVLEFFKEGTGAATAAEAADLMKETAKWAAKQSRKFTESLQDSALDRMYEKYKEGANAQDIFNDNAPGFALRNLRFSAADLEKYLSDRKIAEDLVKAFETFVRDAETKNARHVLFNDDRLKKSRDQSGSDYLEAMQNLLLDYGKIEGWLVEALKGKSHPADRSPKPNDIWYLLGLWRQGEFEKFAEEFCRITGKLAPAAIRQAIIDRFVRKHGGLGKFERAPDQGNIKSKTPLGKLGPVWKDAGAWVDFTPVEVGVKPNPNEARFRGSAGGWSAPIEVGPGKLKLVRQALPPYDQSWISGSNTAVTVKYQPKIGDQWGPEEAIPIDNGFMPVFENEATIPAPGVISVYVGLCYGAGNFLTWQQYAQTWNASLEMVELSEGWSPKVGTAIESGDRVRIDASSQPTIIRLPDGRYLVPEPASEFSISNPEPGVIVVDFHLGGGRVQKQKPKIKKPLAAKSKEEGALEVVHPRIKTQLKVGGKVAAEPHGTDFAFSWDGSDGGLSVVEGSVSVSEIAGERHQEVTTGQRLDFATWEIQDASEEVDRLRQSDPLQDFLGDDSPEAYGEKTSYGLTGEIKDPSDSGWQWLDQGQDAQFRLVGGGMHIEVPEGNAFESLEVSAPQLLHKVTGDFDLETTLHLPAGVSDSAIIIPLLHAPGSGVGYVRGQTEHFGSVANFYRFAPIHRVVPIWAEMGGRAVLPTFAVDPLSGFAAPDEPVLVRFHRRGDIWRTAWSLDGQRWNLSSRRRVSAPETVWVGWAFSHTGNGVRPGEPAVFNLGPAKLVTAPFASLPIPDWDVVDQWGAPANMQLDQVSLAMGPATAGIVKAYSGTEWDFNFDVTLSTDHLEWPEVDGNYVVARVGLRVNDDNRTYVEIHQTGTAIRTETPFVVSQGTYGRGAAILPETLANQWRFQRTEGVVSISRQIDGQWVSMGEFSDIVNGPAFPFIELENAVEGAAPAQVSVRMRVTNNAPVEQRAAEPPNVNHGEQTPSELTPATEPVSLFDNSNPGVVGNNPTQPTSFNLAQAARITYLRTYHYNQGAGAAPGTVTLRDATGKSYGPFTTQGMGQGTGKQPIMWYCEPNTVLPPGKYTIVDSQPATWSHNQQSGSAGIAWVSGIVQSAMKPALPRTPSEKGNEQGRSSPKAGMEGPPTGSRIASDENQLTAIFTASDPEFQTRYVGQKIRVRGTFQQREDANRRVVVDVGAGYRVSGAQIQNGTPNAFETVASFTPVWISGVILNRQSVPDSGGLEQRYLILESNGEFGVFDDSDVSKREPNDSAARMNPAGQPKQPTTKNPELSGAYVDELRRQIAEMLTPHPNQAEPEGWSKSWHDPNRVLGLFKPLHMQEGYVLRAYLHREFNNGSGVVWAMPEDAEYPEPKDCPVLEHHFLQAPKPFDALGDTMEAIRGDDSQWSYFAASILRRELMEFGALWHGSEWGAHSVLDESPFQKQNQQDPQAFQTPLSPRQEWKWPEAEP